MFGPSNPFAKQPMMGATLGAPSPAVVAALKNAATNAPKTPTPPVAGPADKVQTKLPPAAVNQPPAARGPSNQGSSSRMGILQRVLSNTPMSAPAATGTPQQQALINAVTKSMPFAAFPRLGGIGFKKGGKISDKPKKSSPTKTVSASKRGDGIAQRGKTKGRMV